MSDWTAKLSADEAGQLAAQVADLSKAGLPLEGGLRAVADELPHGRLPNVLRELSDRLAKGEPLDVAMQSLGRRLPAHVRGIAVAAVRSGHLAEALEEFIALEHSQEDVRRRVWLSLAYPFILLGMITLLCLFLQQGIVPQFVKIFRDFGTELPALTKFYMSAFGPLSWSLVALTACVLVAVVLPLGVPTVRGAARLLYALPVVGPLWRWNELARFSQLMRLALGQAIPLPEALRLSGAGLPNADLAAGCRQAAEQVEQGQSLREALAYKWQFPPTLLPLIEWGQRVSTLPEAFRAAAEMFQGRVRTQGMLLSAVALPIAFFFILAFVGFFVIAMFLPMISLINRLSG